MKSHGGLCRGMFILTLVTLLIPQSAAINQAAPAAASPLVFTEHIITSGLTAPYAFYAVDLDRDHDVDVLSGAAIAHNGLVWLENDGQQQFVQHIISATTDGLRSICVIDVDGDEDLDIIAGSYEEDYVAWWENDGSQNFTMHLLATLDGAISVTAADLDGDRDTDILAAGYTADRIVWGENDGDGAFVWYTIVSSFDMASSAYAADVDQDGDVDVLGAGRGGGDIAWWENNGYGSFTMHTITSSFGDASFVRATDMDGDGDVDVLGASIRGNAIRWWENDGQEHFTMHSVANPVAPYAVYAVDMDGDSDVDVLSAGGQFPAWWENDGNEGFTERSVTAGARCENAVPADVDSDGDVDVVGGDYYGGEVFWWESNAGDSWPDFMLESLTVTPSQPEIMEGAGIFLDIRNIGKPYAPVKGTVQAEVTLRGANGGIEYLWAFPGTMPALDANASTSFDIYPFMFYDAGIDQVEVCLRADDADRNPANNCRTANVMLSTPAQPWRACIGMLFGIVDALLDALPAKQGWEGVKLVSRMFTIQIPSVIVACSTEDQTCIDAVTAFLVDSTITLAWLATEATALKVIALGHSMGQLLADSADCGDYLSSALRAWTESASHRNVKVSAVVALSPAYVRVFDSTGRRAGFLDDGSVVAEIPGAEAFQSGGDKFVLYPGDDTASVELKGTANGTIGLIASLSRPGDAVVTLEFRAVPVTPTTKGSLNASGTDYALILDDNGDGTPDRVVEPNSVVRVEYHRVRLPLVMVAEGS